MNEKLPKAMLDALARETAPAEHPSADLLAAFVEQALAEGESQPVADHLARCRECREVVFLASGTAEEAVTEEEDVLVAAASAPKELWAGVAAAPAMSPMKSLPKPRRRWMPRLVWVASVAAVFLVVAGYFTRQQLSTRSFAPQVASNMGLEAPRSTAQQQDVAPSKAAPEVATLPAVAKPKSLPAKAAPATRVSSDEYDAIAINAGPPAPAEGQAAMAKGKTEAPKVVPEPVGVTDGGALAIAPAAPKANGFAPSAGETLRQYSAGDSISISVSRALQAAHPGWRVTAQGHLEHLTPDGWTRLLADKTSVFRVVAVVGSNVWAGGNGGALFHSADGGVNWKKVRVAADGVTETTAILSVSFDDAQHGVVTMESGTNYATSDGGVTWTKQ